MVLLAPMAQLLPEVMVNLFGYAQNVPHIAHLQNWKNLACYQESAMSLITLEL